MCRWWLLFFFWKILLRNFAKKHAILRDIRYYIVLHCYLTFFSREPSQKLNIIFYLKIILKMFRGGQ